MTRSQSLGRSCGVLSLVVMNIALALEGLSSGSSVKKVGLGCECALGPSAKAETAYDSNGSCAIATLFARV